MPSYSLQLVPGSFEQSWALRRDYLKSTAAPLDGMWEDAFLAHAAHRSIYRGSTLLGYCAVSDSNALLAFQCTDEALVDASFDHCVGQLGISRAFVSTAEPGYLCLCLDRQVGISVNAVMYEDAGRAISPTRFPESAQYRLVTEADFPMAVEFGMAAIGAGRDWLEEYYSERIRKAELYGLWIDGALQAAGELRVSPSQDGVADAGMVVAPAFRRRGLASEIMKQLLDEGRRRALKVVCSTEQHNLGAKKAISAAGFRACHRILEVSLATGMATHAPSPQ